MKERNILQYIFVSLRGIAMGAADIVPGVSGGTIAFITGIYEELIESINRINFQAVGILKREGVLACWKHINGNFFVFLFLGIGVSLLTLSKIVLYLLVNQPVMLWSFFFGLIIASIWLIGKSIKHWNFGVILSLLVGTGIAFYISSLQTVAHVDAKWYIFLSGMIAICAMILPGISGSFILVLMGSYHIILSALKEKELDVIVLFAAGCLIGLLSFARVLKYLFNHFKEVTIALLTGFMIGSLFKVWPWKNELLDQLLVVHSDKRREYAMTNVLPDAYDGIGQSSLLYAIVFAVLGIGIILMLSKFSPKEV